MELETVNKLYLELSQFATAKTKNDLELLGRAHEAKMRVIDMAEDVERERARPFVLLRPRMFPDGDQWCALYGDNLHDGVAGFGDTPANAAVDFDVQWLNAKARV